MDKKEFEKIYAEKKAAFERYSEDVFSEVKTNSSLADAMKYSYFAGGKRVRPVLMLAYTEIIGGDEKEVLPFAFALECIHTYSLIHDDLPALDNDDLRRGKPTSHVRFGEAIAVLAGDALLNFAFEHVLAHCDDPKKIAAAQRLARLSGYSGMAGGQAEDVENENNENYDEKTLYSIYDKKTVALLSAPFVIPTLMFDGDNLNRAEELGIATGRLFQLVDDYLDVSSTSEIIGKSVGKDASENKLSAVRVFGKSLVPDRIKELSDKCKTLEKSIDKSGFLQCFTSMITRDYADRCLSV